MFWNLLKKELREILTVSSLISIIVLSFFYAVVGKSIGGAVKNETSKKIVVAVVNLDKGRFGSVIEKTIDSYATVIYKGTNTDEAIEKLRANNGSAMLIIEKNFSEKLNSNEQAKIKVVSLLKGLGLMDTIPSETFNSFLNNIEHQIVLTLLTKYGVKNPNFVLDPVGKEEETMYLGKILKGMSPSQLLNYVSEKWTLASVIIMMLMLMSGGTVVSSLGFEKENKTLETLLTMPVKRSYIILSKIFAATIAGLIMGMIFMVGFTVYMKSLEMGSLEVSGIDLSMNIGDYVLVALSIFSALLCGMSIAMLLGLIARDFKSAQMLASPLTILAVFSMLLVQFKDPLTMPVALKIIAFSIPFTHAVTSLRNALFDNYSMLIYGNLYNFALSAILLIIDVKIFNSDIPVTGVRFNRKRRRLFKRSTSI